MQDSQPGPPFPSLTGIGSTLSSSSPVRLIIRVYDLLPPSTLGTLLNFSGFGIHHTAILFPGMVPPLEFAYGGHDEDFTGVFVTGPYGSGGAMKLRWYMDLEVGECFGEQWEKEFGRGGKNLKRKRSLDRGEEGKEVKGLRKLGNRNEANSTSNLISGSEGPTQSPPQRADSLLPPSRQNTTSSTADSYDYPHRSFTDVPMSNFVLDSTESLDDVDEWGSKRRLSTLTTGTTRTNTTASSVHSTAPLTNGASSERYGEDEGGWEDELPTKGMEGLKRALKVVEGMRSEERWRGNRYELLTNNCNTFTSELAYKLTGRRAPGWLNRAAWFGKSFPCLVPADWIEPPPAASAAPTTHERDTEVVNVSYDERKKDRMTVEASRVEMVPLSPSTT
ncbi:DUF862-domain-containing protein [Atractiella rhizophila]|nr:DUF862-domain-containing protein [Atractiella rhizophila]